MDSLHNKRIAALALQCAIQKIPLAMTVTGAIVNSRIYQGEEILTGDYEKGKVRVFEKGKLVKTVDTDKPSKSKDKKANKTKPEDGKTVQDVQGASV